MARVRVAIDGVRHSVESEDVLAWRGLGAPDPEQALELAREGATAYVLAHPRPAPDAQGGINVPARQRMAVLRRLAAGPATKRELLAAMRGAAGYVGGDDWRNRMDELRGHGKRGGGHTPLPIVHDPETDGYRLTEPFPAFSPEATEALGIAKAAVADLGPAGLRARLVLDGMFPGVPEAPRGDHTGAPPPASSGAPWSRPSPRSPERRRR